VFDAAGPGTEGRLKILDLLDDGNALHAPA
jgi:hypothetical protein